MASTSNYPGMTVSLGKTNALTRARQRRRTGPGPTSSGTPGLSARSMAPGGAPGPTRTAPSGASAPAVPNTAAAGTKPISPRSGAPGGSPVGGRERRTRY